MSLCFLKCGFFDSVSAYRTLCQSDWFLSCSLHVQDHHSCCILGLSWASLTFPAAAPVVLSPGRDGPSPCPLIGWILSVSPVFPGSPPFVSRARPSPHSVSPPTFCIPPPSVAAEPPESPPVSFVAPSPSPSGAAPLGAGPAACANLLVLPCASQCSAASPAPAECYCSDEWAVCSLTEKRVAAQSGCPAGQWLPEIFRNKFSQGVTNTTFISR